MFKMRFMAMTCSDNQVRKLQKMYAKTKSVTKAALSAGMDSKTARKWIKAGVLPSEKPKKERTWRTRSNPFNDVWPEIEDKIREKSALQIKDLFEYLCKKYPDKWQSNQLRTLQRLVKSRRALSGPERLAFLEQNHTPGETLQADFSELKSLNISINRDPFTYMMFHSTLPYSNWEWVTVARSESILALHRGFQETFKEAGVKPENLQTDNSTSATHSVGKNPALGNKTREFNADYMRFCQAYSVNPRTTEVGEKEQNGDIESSHNQFKKSVASALALRGSSDFKSISEFELWLQSIARERNSREKRRALFLEEKQSMRVCHDLSFKDYKECKVKVTKFSNVTINRNVYSVPSRLIGQIVDVRQYEWHIEIYFKNVLQVKTEKMLGQHQHNIDYRHVIWSLVAKPGAFACYRYRDEMFPSLIFRQAYDKITQGETSTKKDLEYLRILHLAALISEDEVKVALDLLIEQKGQINYENVKTLVEIAKPKSQNYPMPYKVELINYNKLIVGGV